MEKSVQCDYCNRAVTKFSTLSCNHQVCSKCFLYLCLFNKDTLLRKKEEEEEMTFKCLKCNSGELKTTRKQVNQTNHKTKASDPEINTLCRHHRIREEVLYCEECKGYICLYCFDGHEDVSFFNHQCTTEPVSNTCPKHRNETLEFQCLNCDTPICNFCTETDHKNHRMENIVNFYETKMKEISENFQLMPFKRFKEYNDCLLREHDDIQESITHQSKLIRDNIQSEEAKEDLDNYKSYLSYETNFDYLITKRIYKQLFQELKNLSPKDYFKICTLSKLPYKLHHLSQTNEQLREVLTQRRRFYDDKKIVKTLTGHADSVRCLIQLQDGNIVSGSEDKTIKVWNPRNNKCIKTLTGHDHVVKCLIQLQDGKIASGSYDGIIKIWDSKNNYNCIETLKGHNGYVLCLIQLQDGKIVSGSEDNTIKIWDSKNDYNCIKTLTGHTKVVHCLIQLQDGKIVSWSWDMTIKVWDPENDYNCIKTITGHDGYVSCLIQLENGMICSGYVFEKTIKVWDPENDYNCIDTLYVNSDVRCLIQLQDGMIVSGSIDGTVKVWNPKNGYNCIKTLPRHADTVSCLIQLKDGIIVSGSGDEKIYFWN